jgi:hypothetical protein
LRYRHDHRRINPLHSFDTYPTGRAHSGVRSLLRRDIFRLIVL